MEAAIRPNKEKIEVFGVSFWGFLHIPHAHQAKKFALQIKELANL